MKALIRKSQFVGAVAVTGLLSFAPVSATAQDTIKIDGSSTVFPITEAVAEDFQQSRKGKARVTVGISGTGGGFKKFCRGETDVSDASRPILAREMEECRKEGVQYIELPVAYDAMTVVMNPKNSWVKQLTVADLKKMWEPAAQGKVLKWRQVNPQWPDQALKLFGPGADSGTFDYFTEAINGRAKSSRGDFTASEDDNILVQGIARDINGLGYFGFAYYIENKDKLKAVPIVNPRTNQAIEPSLESVVNGTYQPLARPIFIYVNAKSLERTEVREFVQYYMKNAESLVREVKYIPLPAKAYAQNLEATDKKVLGTKFGGENKVGLTIEELMKLEAKL
ncbi:MAG: PstS family phosphate ABC transporter substrate-binding protein [Betaproteobacteria bacterium]